MVCRPISLLVKKIKKNFTDKLGLKQYLYHIYYKIYPGYLILVWHLKGCGVKCAKGVKIK